MLNERYAYILIFEEKWWNRLLERNRNGSELHVFVRRNRVGPLKTQKLFFYVKKPVMQIRGVADFIERLAGNYKELWNRYGVETCLRTFSEYVNFLGGKETATFIRFTNFHKLQNPVSIDVIRKILGVVGVARGGKYLNREIANQLTA